MGERMNKQSKQASERARGLNITSMLVFCVQYLFGWITESVRGRPFAFSPENSKKQKTINIFWCV